MAAPHQLAFEDAKGGMNAADPPQSIARNQVARLVNCQILDGIPTTRMGCRVIPLVGDFAEVLAEENFQGSCFFNPAKGQGGIVLSEDNATLALSASGRVYLTAIEGRRGNSKARPREVTDGLLTNSQLHLAWLSQWENLLIKSDGRASTFIYDPINGASFSRGYNTVERDQSEIPNGCTVTLYAHGRGVAVVNSRNILVGDSIFRTNLTSSVNLKQFTEQVYQATGQLFLPPTSMGNISAAAVLPLQDTAHGHGSIIFHEEDGMFSLDISQYPRSSWSTLQLVKILNAESGAVGPYALDVQVGDQIYRSRRGADSLRSARAVASQEGSPASSVSPEVDTWFAGDYPRWLRFASVKIWSAFKRIAYTVSPIVHGSHRWHRGFVVRNTDPNVTQRGEAAIWEGLWTLPTEVAGVIQFVGGLFDGEERQFAWCYGWDMRLRLVEFSKSLLEDVLEDGTKKPIRSQAITRMINAGVPFRKRGYSEVVLYLAGIVGEVSWGVWFRPAEASKWVFIQRGTLSNPDIDLTNLDLRAAGPRSVAIPIGKIPDSCTTAGGKSNESRGIQFLVRWEGRAQLENVKVLHGTGDLQNESLDKSNLRLSFAHEPEEEYSDFEYSETDEALWT